MIAQFKMDPACELEMNESSNTPFSDERYETKSFNVVEIMKLKKMED